MRKNKGVKVVTYSGSKGDEHPVEIYIENKKLKVKKWIPLGREEIEGERREGFLIEAEDGEDYVLYHYLEDEKWTILKKS